MNIQTPIQSIGKDWEKKYGDLWKKVAETLQKNFSESIDAIQMPQQAMTDMPNILVKPSGFLTVLGALKKSLGFTFLSDLTATDEMPENPRFCIVYHLMDLASLARVRVKVFVDQEVDSIIPLFKGANWAEREVFDMFGIHFKGHPDLRRILMHEDWEGYPLRKDYPLRGMQIITTAHAPKEALLQTEKGC